MSICPNHRSKTQTASTPITPTPGATSGTLNSVHEILVQDPTGTSLVRSRPLLPLQLPCISKNRKPSPSPSNLRHYLGFCLTLFNTIRSRKMQQRSIWSDSTRLPPAHTTESVGLCLGLQLQLRLEPVPMSSQKNHHSFVPQSPWKLPHQERQCIRNTATSIPAAFQTIQLSNKEFYSFISSA